MKQKPFIFLDTALVGQFALSVKDAANYAQKTGWCRVPHPNKRLMRFQYYLTEYEYTVDLFLPVHDGFQDALLRLAEAVYQLAEVEGRSLLPVLTDLKNE